MTPHLCRRAITVPLRAEPATGETPPRIVGRMIVYDTEVEIGGWFRESIAVGAASACIADTTRDIVSTMNHDVDLLLGRRAAGTFRLIDGPQGVDVEIDVDLNTRVGADCYRMVERGDLRGMSFAFEIEEERYVAPTTKLELPLYIVEKMNVFEGGPVVFPAYATTTAEARAKDRRQLHQRSIDRLEADATLRREMADLRRRDVEIRA